jgi:hypothetical protein
MMLLKRAHHLTIYSIVFLIVFTAIDASGQNTTLVIHPVLRLEKPKYLLGESISFWVGVETDGSGSIPHELWKPCSLTVTKPDGSTELQKIAWPMDGNPAKGWTGGWGIEAKEVGVYDLELACSGERTKRTPLIVEADEVFNKIRASFEFAQSGSIKAGVPVPVIFSVMNDSVFPIRFPQRGVMMEGVSISVKRDSPAYRADFFYPWEKLSQFPLSPETYTWDFATKIPSIKVEPGQRFEQRFALEDAYHFDEPGKYTVTFSTAISVLVGDEQGPYASLCPIRIVAENSQEVTVSGRSTSQIIH